jgi:hypothetical protein
MAGRGLHGWILGVGLMGAAAATGGCGGDDAVQIPITRSRRQRPPMERGRAPPRNRPRQ